MYMNEESLMRSRIRKILMICSNYDAFSLEEDGRVESQIVSEYRELNLSNPPRFIWATSSDQARRIIAADDEIDTVMCLYNDQDRGIFAFADELKDTGRESTTPRLSARRSSRRNGAGWTMSSAGTEMPT